MRSLSGIIESFGLEQFGVLTLVLLAVSTSLPEVIVSVQAARKRKFQIAIGNIFGSSVFNMLFV